MLELKGSKIYTLNIQSVKVLHESDSPPAPVPSVDKKTTPSNSLSLSNGSVYNDFNAFPLKKGPVNARMKLCLSLDLPMQKGLRLRHPIKKKRKRTWRPLPQWTPPNECPMYKNVQALSDVRYVIFSTPLFNT